MNDKLNKDVVAYLGEMSKKLNFAYNKNNKVEVVKSGIHLKYSSAPFGIVYAIVDTLELLYIPISDLAIFRGVLVYRDPDTEYPTEKFYSFLLTARGSDKTPDVMFQGLEVKSIPTFDYADSTVTPLKTITLEQSKTKTPDSTFTFSSAMKLRDVKEELNIIKVGKLLENVFIVEMTGLILYTTSLPLFGVKSMPITYPEDLLVDKEDMREGDSYVLKDHFNAEVKLATGDCVIEGKVAISISGKFYVSTFKMVVSPNGKSSFTTTIMSNSSIANLGEVRLIRPLDLSIRHTKTVKMHTLVPSIYKNAYLGYFHSTVPRISSMEKEDATEKVMLECLDYTNFLSQSCTLGIPTSSINCVKESMVVNEMPNLGIFIIPSETGINYVPKYRVFNTQLTFCTRANNFDKNTYMTMKVQMGGKFSSPKMQVIEPWTLITVEDESTTVEVSNVNTMFANNHVQVERRLEFDGSSNERVTNLQYTPLSIYDYDLVENQFKSLCVNMYSSDFEDVFNSKLVTLDEASAGEILLVEDLNVPHVSAPPLTNYLIVKKYDSDVIANIEIARVLLKVSNGVIEVTIEEPYLSERQAIKHNTKVIPLKEFNEALIL